MRLNQIKNNEDKYFHNINCYISGSWLKNAKKNKPKFNATQYKKKNAMILKRTKALPDGQREKYFNLMI